MRPPHAIALALIGAACLGSPALARVDAPRTLMPPEAAAALSAQLDRVGDFHFDAAIVKDLAEPPAVVAAQMFKARQMAPHEALIVVSMSDRMAGVAVGSLLAGRGLDAEAIQRVVEAIYAPKAATGDVAIAVRALAEALAAYDPAVPLTSNPAPASAPFPWVPLIGVVLLGAGAFVGFRVMTGRLALARRLPPLQQRLTTLKQRRAQAIKALAPLAAAVRFDGAAPDAWTTLRERLQAMAWGLTEDAERLALAFGPVEDALDAGKPDEAEPHLAALESRAWLIETGAAALATALGELGRMTAPGAIAAALDDMRALALDWLETRALLAERQRTAGETGFLGLEATKASQQAREVLTAAPVDRERARTLLAEAGRSIGMASVVVQATRQRAEAASGEGWDTAAYVISKVVPRSEVAPAEKIGPNGTRDLDP